MSDRIYDPHSIEPKWQRAWDEQRLYHVTEDASKPKKYVLEMFPYPSGDIHMGHVRNYTIGDVVARSSTMRGYNVLHPIGWDAFGLPAENAAIKSNSHPAKWTYANIETQRASFKRMGFSYDWDRQVVTCDQDYYRWGQWIFLKFWERGLVERRSSPVNWCPSCATVLANEQVVGEGACWRCKSTVEKRELEQWYLKITEYADELLDDLDAMPGWPERVKTMQANWIGRSEGAEVDFELCDAEGNPSGSRHHGVHHAPRHPVRVHVLPARAGAPAGVRARGRYGVRGRGHRGGRAGCPRDRRRARDGGAREARRVHRSLRGEPGEPAEGPGVGRRLRPHGLRHRCGHGGALRRPARLRVRSAEQAADRARGRARGVAEALRRRVHRCDAVRGGLGRGVRGPRRDDQLRGVLGNARRQGIRRHARGHEVAGDPREGSRLDQLPPARLADQPPALLGQPHPRDPLRALRARSRARGPAAGRAADGRGRHPWRDARRPPRVLRDHVSFLRRGRSAGDRHDGHVHVLVVVLPALLRRP